MRFLPILLLCLVSDAQTILENFSSVRTNGQGAQLFSAYLGEDPNQVCNIDTANGLLACTGASTGTGKGIYWQILPQGTTGYNYTAPCTSGTVNCGYMQHWIRSGSWTTTYNRLSIDSTCQNTIAKAVNGGANVQWGNYIRIHSSTDPVNQGQHYYNFLNSNFYAGTKVTQVLNNHPQHRVGMGGGLNWPNDPSYAVGTSPEHWQDDLTRWYWDTQNIPSFTSQPCSFSNITLSQVDNEPDEYVSGVSATYSGTAYELGFMGVKNDYSTFKLYHKTTSMHSGGLSTGTYDGSFNYDSVGHGGPNDSSAASASVTVASSSTMYLALKPVMAIVGVTYGANTAIITKVNPLIASGAAVTITSVNGITNGTYYVGTATPTYTASGDETQTSTLIYTDAGLTMPLNASGSYSGHAGTLESNSDTLYFTEVAYGTVAPPVTPSVTTSSPMAGGTKGIAYSQTLQATNGTPPYTWAVSAGALPTGLSLNASTGAITGTPTAAAAFSFSVIATDSLMVASAAAPLSITISISTPSVVNTSPLASGTQGTPYSQTLTCTSGVSPYGTWTVASGSLPTSLSLNSSTGAITGTPTVPNVFNFTATCTDNIGTVSAAKSLQITIAQGSFPIITTTSPMASGTQGTAYSQTITSTGGVAPLTYTVSSGTLPTSLSLATTGVLSGTPTVPAVYNFTVIATDSLMNASPAAPLQITITTSGGGGSGGSVSGSIIISGSVTF